MLTAARGSLVRLHPVSKDGVGLPADLSHPAKLPNCQVLLPNNGNVIVAMRVFSETLGTASHISAQIIKAHADRGYQSRFRVGGHSGFSFSAARSSKRKSSACRSSMGSSFKTLSRAGNSRQRDSALSRSRQRRAWFAAKRKAFSAVMH